MLSRLLARRREARERQARDASDLMTFLGEHAYHEARDRAREARDRSDPTEDRHWGKVAVEIARRTGRVIGGRSIDQPAAPTTIADPRRMAIADELVEIAEAIAAFARGRDHATSLHNAEAAVIRLTARVPAAEPQGFAVRRALRDLASCSLENAAAISAGIYPPRAQTAGNALQRLRDAVMDPRTNSAG